MRSRLLKFACAFVMFLAASAMAAEFTAQRLVANVVVSATQIYIGADPTGWGASQCPTAYYVYVDKTEAPHAREILAMVLTAKSAGRQISFYGACHTDPNYFFSSYVQVH